jgi:protein-S-isoprenylcysteine O-methyltransferase Ste14
VDGFPSRGFESLSLRHLLAWGHAVRGYEVTQSGSQPARKLLPPVYFYLLLAMEAGLHYLLPLGQIIGWPWRAIGLVPIGFGMIINMLADRLFKQKQTTVKPFEPPGALIVNGPFRLSRHPMYLGMAAVLVGVAVVSGSLAPFAGPALFIGLMELVFIQQEEKVMQETFGEQYRQYKRRVRRWV